MNLNQAIKYYAETYQGMVVGSTFEEGYNIAQQIAEEFKYRWEPIGYGAFPDNYVADFVVNEANAMEM